MIISVILKRATLTEGIVNMLDFNIILRLIYRSFSFQYFNWCIPRTSLYCLDGKMHMYDLHVVLFLEFYLFEFMFDITYVKYITYA